MSLRILETVAEMRAWRSRALRNQLSVGLVPTMGALHQGHLDLVRASAAANAHTVVSIFVNPSQFAPHEDLKQYPRTLESDVAKLATVGSADDLCVFLPSIGEMYPSGIPLEQDSQKGAFVEVKGLSEQLEGAIRPHFFRGVATVVTKLLNIVGPEQVYFGQKDMQQSVVIRRLVRDLLIPTTVNVVATAREANGLAMSSRNAYLSSESRQKAAILYRALTAGKAVYDQASAEVSRSAVLDTVQRILDEFAAAENFDLETEYLALSDKNELVELDSVRRDQGAVISAAIRVPNAQGGKTRIIDNVEL